MAFLFPQKKPKSLAEIVYSLNEAILRASDQHHVHKPLVGVPNSLPPTQSFSQETVTEQQKQACDDANKLLMQIKVAQLELADPEQLAAFAKEVYTSNVLIPLLLNLKRLEFDARQNVVLLFTFLLQRPPTIDFLVNKSPEIFTLLLTMAGESQVHQNACQILRELSKFEPVVKYLMTLQNFWWFFQYIDNQEFEIATDAYITFYEFLKQFPELTANFLLQNMDYFTKCVNGLIGSKHYIARRQALKLLYWLMKQPRNQQYLRQYVSEVESLKLIMTVMRQKSKNIYYESFQIFKCFVVNPERPKLVVDILLRNRPKLVELLEKPHKLPDRRDDQQFQNERRYVIDKLVGIGAKADFESPTRPGQLPRVRPASPVLTTDK